MLLLTLLRLTEHAPCGLQDLRIDHVHSPHAVASSKAALVARVDHQDLDARWIADPRQRHIKLAVTKDRARQVQADVLEGLPW